MTKSRERADERKLISHELSKVYVAIFQDLTYAYPDDADWFEKDQARLFRLVEQRGPFQVFLVDLPAAGKHLDQALASGTYRCSGLPLTGKGPGHVQMPEFLRQLYLRVFDESGNLKEDYDAQAIFFLRQLLLGAKRTSVQCSDKHVEKEINEFIQVDTSLPDPEKFWNEENPPSAHIPEAFRGFSKSTWYAKKVSELPGENQADATRFLVNLDLVSGFISSALGPYRVSEWRFKHGPGAISVKAPRNNKYCWTHWSERLESVFPYADCGFHNWMAWADERGQHWRHLSETPPSKLIDVPKTFTKPRLIAAEPGENQWCQQNLKAFLYSRTKATWLDGFVRFRDQTLNQSLCTKGARTGLLATIDLSAASDRVSCHAVGNLFRSNWNLLQALRASRTQVIAITHKVPRKGEPVCEQLLLRKFSTMGSACTFPVESLMFLASVLAAVLTIRKKAVNLKNISDLVGEVAVFGDDIVVPIDSRELLVRGLEIIDFKVNTSKSFWTGKFRESCGVDSYAGIDVTPAYYKSPYQSSKPESLATAIEVSNNFYEKFLVRTSNAIASQIVYWARKDLAMIPTDSGATGVKSFLRPLPGTRMDGKPLLKRFNRALQKTEYRTCCISSKCRSTSTSDHTALLQYFTEEPEPFTKWKSGPKQRPRLKVKAKHLGEEAWISS